MRTKNTDKKGISLIVLVITIIVMIILATSVVMTLSNSGIIEKANEAVEATNLAQVRDLAKMLWADAYLDKTIPKDQIENVVLAKLEEAIGESNFAKYTITVTASGVRVEKKKEIDVASVITLDSELSEESTNPTIATGTSYTLTGKVTDDKGIKSFTVNGVAVTVAQDGTWSTTLTLVKDKLTEVTIVATDTAGNTTTKTGYVGYITYTNYSIVAANRYKVGYDADAASQDIVIPARFYDDEDKKWYKVTTVGTSAFNSCANIKSVTIEEGVTYIFPQAFAYCNGLESVVIPASVTSMDHWAFKGCGSLSNVTFGENSKLTSISEQCFTGCSSLENITISDSVTSISAHAFYNCTRLTSVTLPESLESIDENAFLNCTKLKEVRYKGDITDWLEISYANAYSNPCFNGAACYMNDVLVTSVDIPNGVDEIKTSAFEGWSSLTKITIPNSVTSIGARSFRACVNLESVTLSESITIINDRTFSGCVKLTSVVIPSSVTTIDLNAFWGCTSLTNIQFNGTVEQWSAITKGGTGTTIWNYNVPATAVICSDGTVSLK